MDFTAIDFETANPFRGSPCAVGLVRVRDGVIVDELSTLIQPPRTRGEFSPHNVRVHGITPEDVATAPEWADAYPKIMDFIGDDVVVAHQADFEVSVFVQACAEDGLEHPTFDFLCTKALAKKALSLPTYGLPFVAQALGFTVESHHDALADAQAAAEIFIRLAAQVNAENVSQVASRHHVHLGKTRPGGSPLRTSAFLGPGARHTSSKTPPLPNLDAAPDGYLYGRVLVISGNIPGITKSDAWAAAAEVGAIPAKNVTKKTNVLVVGDFNAGSLKPGATYSDKVQEAFDLQVKGQSIEIMTADDFFDSLLPPSPAAEALAEEVKVEHSEVSANPSDLTSLIPPARRDVRGMTQVLASINAGEILSALCKDDLYGTFRITGKAYNSPSTGLLLIGGRSIASAGKPDKDLLTLVPVAEQPSAGLAVVRSASDIHHGDFVSAEFSQHPYGSFLIEGQAVETADRDLLLVGHWIIRGSDGAPAPRLFRVASRRHDNIPSVSRIASWRDDES